MTAKFGATSTTDDVLAGLDLKDKRVLVTGTSSGLGIESIIFIALRRSMPLRFRNGALFREPRSRQRALAVHCRLLASCRGDHRKLVLDQRVARLARRLVLDHRRQ